MKKKQDKKIICCRSDLQLILQFEKDKTTTTTKYPSAIELKVYTRNGQLTEMFIVLKYEPHS